MGKACVSAALLFQLCLMTGKAQEKALGAKRINPGQIGLQYNFAHIGQNLSLEYTHYFGRHALTGGIKYHLGTTIRNKSSRFNGFAFRPPDYSVGPASSRAGSFRSRLSFTIGYQYRLKKKESWLAPYLFYQLQSSFSLHGYRDFQRTGSYTIFENAVGAGIRPVLHMRWHLDAGAGIGPAFFYDETGPITSPRPVTRPIWFNERMLLLRLGLVYRLRD